MGEWKGILQSFGYAIEGIIYTIRTQRNMRIHLGAAIVVLLLSWGLEISIGHLLLVLFSISFVLILELINTAIEATVDLVTDEYHPLAKVAKDVAAGAVLLGVLTTIGIGIYVFFNPGLSFLRTLFG